MVEINGELSAAQRVVLAIDTSDMGRALELAEVARDAGASIIKEGLEVASAPFSSWEDASRIAHETGLDWVADTKADDISATVGAFMMNIVRLEHPPVAITMHTHAGLDSMSEAKLVAAEHGILILGVTELTSIKEEELRRQFGFVLARLGMEALPERIVSDPDSPVRKAFVHMRAQEAWSAGLDGLVASPKELVDPIKSDPNISKMFTMIPGARSAGVDSHDQNNVDTPEATIANGADLLVIGREVTQSDNPAAAFQNVVAGIQRGLNTRNGVA